MKKPKIIGLTGGIGSGKTTVAKIFESLGVPIYIADVEAKKLMESEFIIRKIEEEFGSSVISNHQIDRMVLAKIVFDSPEKLKKLNEIVHPAVAKDFESWVAKHLDHPFVIKETAILFEMGGDKFCDKTILVTAPKEIRIDRVMKRDRVTETEVLKRMNQQWSDDRKLNLADFIINNIDSCDLFSSVTNIIKKLNNL